MRVLAILLTLASAAPAAGADDHALTAALHRVAAQRDRDAAARPRPSRHRGVLKGAGGTETARDAAIARAARAAYRLGDDGRP